MMLEFVSYFCFACFVLLLASLFIMAVSVAADVVRAVLDLIWRGHEISEETDEAE